MILYDYYRSSASYRVRIALNLKGLAYETQSVHLINNGGEQHRADYARLNPQELVPCLITDDDDVLSQSLAIIEYLNDSYPTPPLLPDSPIERAQVRSMALLIACDVHPLNNLRVLQRLREQFQARDEQVSEWMQEWMHRGFRAFEQRLQHSRRAASVCFGDTPGMADLVLIPQVYNALRFQVSLDDYPLIQTVYESCNRLTAFQNAAPTAPPTP